MKFEPNLGHQFIYIDSLGLPSLRTFNNSPHDKYRVMIGNCFPPNDEGQKMAFEWKISLENLQKSIWK